MNPVHQVQSVQSAAGDIALVSPLTGRVVPLAEVPDPVFSEGLFGDGVAVDPVVGRLVAPCDGIVMHLARTGHAVTLQTAEGAQVLVHIGIDTLELHGKGFHPKVAQGAQVRRGDLLIAFDLDVIANEAPSLVSVVAIANSDAFEVVARTQADNVEAGVSPLLVLRLREGAEPPAGDTSPVETEARKNVTLTHAGGLHARPAARAREAARGFDARVEVRFGERKAAIESVVGLLALGAGEGATVELVGIGHDAQKAVDAAANELTREAPGEGGEVPARRLSPVPRAAVAAAPQTAAANAPSHTLSGVCASPGIAVGTFVRWHDAAVTPPELASGSPASESGALDKAIAAVDAELNGDVRAASQRGAIGEAGIFTMHRVLLEDPTLIDDVRHLIGLGKSAGYALHEAIRAQIAVLGKVDDPLLADRAADLRDIEKRVLRALGYANTAARALPEETVLAADEFTPSDLAALERKRVTALVMAHSGATSHAAIIARQAGIAALVAIGDGLRAIPEGTQVIVDADEGRLSWAPTPADIERARAERQRLARVREADRHASQQRVTTRDGRSIEVAANIATLEDAHAAVENGADAVGLLRTELMFIHRKTAPTVEEHRESYQAIVKALAGRTAIIRTLDVGADKEVDYLTLPPEPNPALGLRGIRLAQVRPDLLDDQLRGLVAVRPEGAVRIMLPMVTDSGEVVRVRERIDTISRELGRSAPVEVGVMIEVPSAALLADQIAEHADFLSLGTNDLTQYTLAMDRGRPDLATQADGLHPAVLRLIAATVQGAEKHGKWVGVCGALAGDLVAVPLLVGLGVTELSVDPGAVPAVKARLRTLDWKFCHERAQEALALESAQAVRAASRGNWPLE
ncbi:phosphoenolpyruvate--protein phosphotransferase [Paraburkholderia dinghuensis]|uniref:phosphoenolpyruvate--protein phosphotransferase n=1 Tax=Paraburkholderia dinghuensis TaxID=2305225 RepID=A0A3N6N260_9BURK|nr:phosphoenolpyruvate--protein phosphotransferase [Paraburkholderia dinghuensis]RQH04621.1 phosphoenolpyruvate--protein phosphotransferase [Paraburkholderia dinghuensis]